MDSKINKFYVGLLSVIVALAGSCWVSTAQLSTGPFHDSKIFGIPQSSFGLAFRKFAHRGSIIGNFIGGILADKFGRKSVLIGTASMFAFAL
jgi:MFS family permease